MEYYGKLYGKIGNKYLDTGKTSSDFDNTSHQIEKLKADKEELLEALETVLYNSDVPNEIYDQSKSLIQKHKPCEIK